MTLRSGENRCSRELTSGERKARVDWLAVDIVVAMT